MARIRIRDKNPTSSGRRAKIWQCFGQAKVTVYKVEDVKNAFYAVANEETIEKLMSTDCKAIFQTQQFEIQDPPEYNAMRTVTIRNIDRQIIDYEESEIKETIERENGWAKVEEVIKLPNAPTIIKVRFETTQMAKKALESGMLLLHQSIPSRFIEKEIFINLVPCYRCYKYDHMIKDCKEPETYRACSECSAKDHTYKNCNNITKKCLNCNGDHRTLAAKCQTRKNIIKERTKQERQALRSQTTATSSFTQASYARAVTEARTATTVNPEAIIKSLPPNAAASIMSAIIFAYIQEAKEPGSFQKTVDEMYDLNNIPRVRFPSQNNASETLSVLMGNTTVMDAEADNRQGEMEHEETSNKRVRETSPTQETAAKKTASEETSQRGQTESDEEYRLPRPIHHQEEEETRPKPRRQPERKASVTKVKLPEIRLRAKVESIGFIPKRPSHREIAQFIQTKLIKYTYYHPDIYDDQTIRDQIHSRIIDLSAYRIQYVAEDAFNSITNGTRGEHHTARKSSTDPDII